MLVTKSDRCCRDGLLVLVGSFSEDRAARGAGGMHGEYGVDHSELGAWAMYGRQKVDKGRLEKTLCQLEFDI